LKFTALLPDFVVAAIEFSDGARVVIVDHKLGRQIGTKSMLIYDETGQKEHYLSEIDGSRLERLTEKNAYFLFSNFSNLWLMGVLKRGEYARSWNCYSQFQKIFCNLYVLLRRTLKTGLI